MSQICVKSCQSNGTTSFSVDHTKDEEVKRLFERIQSEQHKLDILVNNAYAAVNYIMENMGKPFWEGDPGHGWDITNNVGLRNNYICSVYAARYTQPSDLPSVWVKVLNSQFECK